MTDRSINTSHARPGLVAGARYAALAALILLMVAVLTASQISYAYMNAAGTGGSVSAIRIRDEADDLVRYRSDRREATRALDKLRTDQGTLRRQAGQAGILAYVQKVHFRRYIFACYPTAAPPARTAADAVSTSQASELSWYTLLEVYRATTELNPVEGCDERVAAPPRTPVSLFGEPQRVLTDHFRDCSETAIGRARLECLWDNVTTGVWLVSAIEQAQASLGAELAEQTTYRASLDVGVGAQPVLGSPTGRAAVEAWRQLSVPEEALHPVRNAAGNVVATLVTFPILAQSALLALLAGGVGGGLARIWELLGYRRSRTRVLDRAAAAVVKGQANSRAASDPDPLEADRSRVLAAEIAAARAAVIDVETRDRDADQTPLITGIVSGAGSALVFWLLTTSGLFVLSGGDNTASASPNVLLAISLAAGMAYQQVIRRIFAMTEDYVGSDDSRPAADGTDR